MHSYTPEKLWGEFFTLSHCPRWLTFSYCVYSIHATSGRPDHYRCPDLFLWNVVLRESSVQYSFGQERTPPLIRVVVILLGILVYKLSLNSLSGRLLEAQGVWHETMITVTSVHLMIVRRSMIRVPSMYMSIIMAQATPWGILINVILPSIF
jgi:hypothetical protein